jgi:ABC-2 type transport system ATP-binding protein
MSANDIAIEVVDLVKLYPTKHGPPIRAVDGMSFQVRRGEIFGLLGPNGAGKTTIVKILTTIIRPTSGTARVMNHNVASHPLEVRKQIAVVLQETALEMFMSVRDNLEIYGRLHYLPLPVLRQRIEQVLDQFGLREKQREKVQDLSGGLRRRLQVAKVFLVDAPIIFLDEATTGMDPLIKRQTLEAIGGLAKQGRTIFLTTQILEEAEALCDNLIIMNRGKAIASGDLDTLRTLATRMFHVSLTFAQPWPEAIESVRRLNPMSIHATDQTVEMTFDGGEPVILEHLAALSSRWRIDRFEVRGPDLEEVFVELLGKDGGGRGSRQ